VSFHLQLLAAAGKRLDVIVTITTRKLSLGLRKGKHIKLTQTVAVPRGGSLGHGSLMRALAPCGPL